MFMSRTLNIIYKFARYNKPESFKNVSDERALKILSKRNVPCIQSVTLGGEPFDLKQIMNLYGAPAKFLTNTKHGIPSSRQIQRELLRS